MKRSLSRLQSWRGLLAVVTAGLAALSVTSPATASSSSTGTSQAAAAAGVRLSATARRVNLRQLPQAGATGHARVLPALRPNRSGSGTATKTATPQSATAAAPQNVAAGSTGFVGDSYTQQDAKYGADQDVVPPDNGTATNQSYVVEFLNDSGWVYLRNNGSAGPVFSVDLNTMFIDPADMTGCSAKPKPTSPCYTFSDPRVVWDAQSGRWFASGLAFDIFNFNSKEYVAVTDNWDATMKWTVNTVWKSTAYLGDQPRMGVTSDKVVDFWDDYDSPTLSFQQEEGVTVTKAALETGATIDGTNSNDFTKKATSPSATNGWLAVVPAWDSTTTDTWAMWNDTDSAFTSPTFTADGKVHVIHITGSATSPTFTETSYSPHAGATGGGTGMTAPQPGPGMVGSGPAINADDDRTQTTVFDGTHLVTTANTTCGSSQICVRVFRVTISSGTPSYVGDTNITAAGMSVYYGAPALDGAGNLTVAFSESNASTTWPSSAISGATAAAPLGFGAPAIIHAGQAMYNETGFLQECVVGVYSCRWGDYQGAQPDPCDSSFVWTSTEFADSNTTSAANWSTFIVPTTFGSSRVPASCASAPTVTSLSTTCGNAGDTIIVNGTGFVSGSVAYFANKAVVPTSINVAGTQMTVTVPAKGTASVVDVTVVNGNGQSALSSADQYSYVGSTAPTVTAVAPNTEPADGTTAVDVTVTGTNFEYPLTVHFGTVGSQVVGSSGPNATCTKVVVTAPASATAQAVDVTAQDSNGTSLTNANDKFYYIDGGYTMDAYGGVHEYGNVQAPPHRTDGPSWPGWQIARQMVLRQDRGSGYVLDGWGGIHPFGGAPAVSGGPYWPGWDIARDIVLNPCDSSGTSGYVLDGWGGIHPFGGAPGITGYPYWPGWDIARSMVLNSCGHGGYVLDGWGGVHAFGGATTPTGLAYWPGWDIARGIVLTADGSGYTLDGWGGVHAFGGATTPTGFAYWPGWDIARGITWVPGAGGYTIDGWGGIHPFNGSASVTGTSYLAGQDIFRDID